MTNCTERCWWPVRLSSYSTCFATLRRRLPVNHLLSTSVQTQSRPAVGLVENEWTTGAVRCYGSMILSITNATDRVRRACSPWSAFQVTCAICDVKSQRYPVCLCASVHGYVIGHHRSTVYQVSFLRQDKLRPVRVKGSEVTADVGISGRQITTVDLSACGRRKRNFAAGSSRLLLLLLMLHTVVWVSSMVSCRKSPISLDVSD